MLAVAYFTWCTICANICALLFGLLILNMKKNVISIFMNNNSDIDLDAHINIDIF